MSEYALQLNNITKTYKDGEGENTVLNNISLKLKKGEFVAIAGPSGSGKTTLLSITGALLSPTKGSVIIGDTSISDKNKKNWTSIRSEQIGFIFQNHQLIPYLNVREQLIYMCQIGKKSNKENLQNVDKLLEELGLSKRLKAYPNQLSGGEKQRVAIARAFINQPDLILADEPTSSLDGDRGRQVVELIRAQTKKNNKSAIIVTHDERILDIVDKVYKISNGKLIF